MIWKETKQQPGTAGPGNMLGCCLICFHFLWDIHPIRPVEDSCNLPFPWCDHLCILTCQSEQTELGVTVSEKISKNLYLSSACKFQNHNVPAHVSQFLTGWEMIHLLMQLNLSPSLCPAPARGREARKHNPSIASRPIWVQWSAVRVTLFR